LISPYLGGRKRMKRENHPLTPCLEDKGGGLKTHNYAGTKKPPAQIASGFIDN